MKQIKVITGFTRVRELERTLKKLKEEGCSLEIIGATTDDIVTYLLSKYRLQDITIVYSEILSFDVSEIPEKYIDYMDFRDIDYTYPHIGNYKIDFMHELYLERNKAKLGMKLLFSAILIVGMLYILNDLIR